MKKADHYFKGIHRFYSGNRSIHNYLGHKCLVKGYIFRSVEFVPRVSKEDLKI